MKIFGEIKFSISTRFFLFFLIVSCKCKSVRQIKNGRDFSFFLSNRTRFTCDNFSTGNAISRGLLRFSDRTYPIQSTRFHQVASVIARIPVSSCFPHHLKKKIAAKVNDCSRKDEAKEGGKADFSGNR